MSGYTTGEMAKAANVTVRTVQYYDKRNLVTPSAFTEGGRRLYTDGDLQKLKAVCFLRELDLPIGSIQKLIDEEDAENVIRILIEQQKILLTDEIKKREAQLEQLSSLSKDMRLYPYVSVETVGDIAYMMEGKKRLRNLRIKLLTMGLFAEAIEWLSIICWIVKGVWIYYVLSIPLMLIAAALITYAYVKNVEYLCPECHRVFKPGKKEMFFARHTMYTRKLTCTHCGHNGFSIEVFKTEDNKNA